MSVGRLFGYCVLPGSVSMAVSAMYIVIDGMFVGHYMGHESLAAANMMWPLLGAVFAVAMMIGTGSAVQIAKYLGEKRNLRANRTFTVGVFTA
ncbi:MAG: MATE family efflux transporter, partial [Succinatimonas sp.]|nr:MATE family efflux transporter [Succinatimonas sp.]